MQKKQYLQKNNKYILNSKEAFFLYFDYFSPGIKLPYLVDSNLTRQLIHSLFDLIVKFVFLTKTFRLLGLKSEPVFTTVSRTNPPLIIIKGKGAWQNKIQLIKRNYQLFIQKEVASSEIFTKEKLFYNTYKNNTSNIKLPPTRFLKNNIVEMQFIKGKRLERLIKEGKFNQDRSTTLLNKLKERLQLFYKGNKTIDNQQSAINNQLLIHGDLGTANIILRDKDLYLIDYSDCHKYEWRYDLFVLFNNIKKNLPKALRDVAQSILDKNISVKAQKKYRGHLNKRLQIKHEM